ncbi:MAG: HD-GYP domain-containing protein [Rhodothermales bacterium]|nr:HD-GYP domain-containing protein [Rhodothermales bacterium]
MAQGDGRALSAYRLFIFGVVLAGVPTLVWGAMTAEDKSLLVVLIAAGALVDLFPARLRSGVTISVAAVVTLAGLLLGGVPVAVGSCIGTAALSLFRATDRRFVKAAFNSSQKAIAALVAGHIFEALSARPSVVESTSGELVAGITAPRSLLSLLVTAAVYEGVGYLFVAGVVSLDSGEKIRSVLRHGFMPALLEIPYAALAVLASILVIDVGPQSLLLMVVPTLVARTGLHAFQHVDEAYERLVRSFAKTIEIKDEYTKGHSERVSYLSDLVAGHLRLGYEDRRLVRYAAMLHDVGKIGVPLCVINKPGPLDDAEFDQMKQHPVIGENILRDIDFLLPVLDVVRHHHERLDGRGYPDGLSAEDLTQAVRIVTAVDAFDAMTSTRSYRRSMSVSEAVDELHAGEGTQFDRVVVAALEEIVRKIEWQPTVSFTGDVANIPNVTHVKPLAERHDFVPEGRLDSAIESGLFS